MADELSELARAELAERLSVWAQPLCWTPSLTSEAMYRRIRVLLSPAVLDAYGVSVEQDDWPEPGLRFRLGRGGPTREQLELRMGEGYELPTLHPGGLETVAFRIGEPGAPFEVSVFASFPGNHRTSGARSVVMQPHTHRPAPIQRKVRDPTADPDLCPDCGTRNLPDATFCANCGRFLEW